MPTAPHPGTALVTGASSGIGAAYADRLARRGHDLVLVARCPDRLEALAQRLSRATGRTVEYIAADLTDPDRLARVESLLRTDGRVTTLVNTAGLCAAAPLLETDAERLTAMIGLNVTALARLTHAAVPGLVRRGGGTVVNVACVTGIRPELLGGVYAATKAFVLAFSQSLRHELADRNIRVQAVCPGAVAPGTPPEHAPGEETAMTAGDLVDAALAGLDQGEFVTIPSLPDPRAWEEFEAARRRLTWADLSRRTPAARYGVGRAAA